MGALSRRAAGVACLGFALLSCGGSQPGSKAPTQTPQQRAAAQRSEEEQANEALDAAVPKLWATMNAKERYHYMEATVLPAMKTVFEAYDPNRFEKMNCATCHGADAEARQFKMPNPDLVKVSAANDFAAARKKYPGAVEFMMSSVEPTMASLLQDPVFSNKTKHGFGCFRCHVRDGGR